MYCLILLSKDIKMQVLLIDFNLFRKFRNRCISKWDKSCVHNQTHHHHYTRLTCWEVHLGKYASFLFIKPVLAQLKAQNGKYANRVIAVHNFMFNEKCCSRSHSTFLIYFFPKLHFCLLYMKSSWKISDVGLNFIL